MTGYLSPILAQIGSSKPSSHVQAVYSCTPCWIGLMASCFGTPQCNSLGDLNEIQTTLWCLQHYLTMGVKQMVTNGCQQCEGLNGLSLWQWKLTRQCLLKAHIVLLQMELADLIDPLKFRGTWFFLQWFRKAQANKRFLIHSVLKWKLWKPMGGYLYKSQLKRMEKTGWFLLFLIWNQLRH
jgi:hypothetical protein